MGGGFGTSQYLLSHLLLKVFTKHEKVCGALTMREEDFNQYAVGLTTLDLHHLKSRHSELLSGLNTVDQLRDVHLGKYVELPQIIVVGDQSSGKSSVLEAISRVRFPSKSSLCTRFATELVLRDAADPRIDVSIKPHEKATKEVKEKLTKFTASETKLGELSNIINKASTVMGIDDGSKAFSKHILCIKIFGPGIPPLTLVDLPGFYHARGLNQGDEHRALVDDLAAEYMNQEASIILAVISAKSGLEMQKVLQKTKQYDPRGRRTLGIVTKPDQLEKGEMENEFVKLVKNTPETPWHLKHGWYVLRNRAEKDDVDFDTRDRAETKLLSSAPWTSIRQEYKGISPLRQKLSDMLLTHTGSQLPRVTSRIRELMKEQENHLANLGEPRIDPRDCRVYLGRIAKKLEHLTRQAVGGETKDSEFFGAICEGSRLGLAGGEHNLRARVRKLNQAFIAIMGKHGSRRNVEWRDKGMEDVWALGELPSELKEFAALYDLPEQERVTQDDLESEVQEWAIAARGNEFPDEYPSSLMLTLFENQAAPWKSIAARHLELVVEEAESLVLSILTHVSGDDNNLRERVAEEFVAPFFADRRAALESKLEELIPQVNGDCQLLALEWVYMERTQARSRLRLEKQWEELQENIKSKTGNDSRDSGNAGANLKERASSWSNGVQQLRAENLIDSMVVFYGMTMETFMTNIITLAVEKQLMARIPSIFGTAQVMGLKDDQLKELAEESEDSQAERSKTEEDLAKLKRGLELCESWRKSNNSRWQS
ncbi:hypothetical protein JDV02_000843 [Purpureocillium takamizusanense]|uniref:Dynamin GTPase n=1 Tax=Purpureocillium takamizusanense TaxID=2060973 RepID=A0A9Q8Q7H2_9HYPO|nr:uncharacterized protein JDV02_000843 [Purpureocillium takamizusanense]UNI14187.1 hypothetical protein JDV02_000843 [Purpureocillium takamizusanense]